MSRRSSSLHCSCYRKIASRPSSLRFRLALRHRLAQSATASVLDAMEPSLFAWAQEALSNHLHESAIFVAERLVAEAERANLEVVMLHGAKHPAAVPERVLHLAVHASATAAPGVVRAPGRTWHRVVPGTGRALTQGWTGLRDGPDTGADLAPGRNWHRDGPGTGTDLTPGRTKQR